jgi:hydrogenase-4 component B
MLAPMAFFALLCLVIGSAPQLALHLVSPAVEVFSPGISNSIGGGGFDAALGAVSLVGALLLAVAVLVTLVWRWRLGSGQVDAAPTWGCGYQRGTARMQYGGTSFSEFAVSVFNGIMRQRVTRPAITGLFPKIDRCSDQSSETLLDGVFLPLFSLTGKVFGYLHRLQHGLMHIYMLYIFAALLILMLWAH